MRIITAFVAAVLCFGAFSASASEQDMRPRVCIDTKKVVNKTDDPRANFQGLIDRLNHELVQCGMYRVIRMADFESTLVDNEKFAVAADDGGQKTNIKTPGYFIRLTVMKYGHSHEKRRDVLYGSETLNQVATVELILTLVDMRTAETITSRNIKRTAIANVNAGIGERKVGNYDEQSMQSATKYVCLDIINELVKYTPFNVMDVNGQEIMIDAPPSIAKVGSLFDIFKAGKAIRNRRTGKVTLRETKICTISITSVGEDSCTGNIVKVYTQEPVKVDYIVRPSTAVVVQQAAPAAAAPSAAAPF